MIEGLLIVCGAVAVAAASLLLVERTDDALETRFPAYARAWAAIFGETPEPLPVSHVRAVSPYPCRACQRVGLHDVGCSRLDRLDAGQVRR